MCCAMSTEAPEEPVFSPDGPAGQAKESPVVAKKDDEPGKADVIALGIGCLVFVIMFVAVVLVGMTKE